MPRYLERGIGGRGRSSSFFVNLLRFAFFEGSISSRHEKVITHSIDVFECILIDIATLQQRGERSFGSSANCTRHVQMSSGKSSTLSFEVVFKGLGAKKGRFESVRGDAF